MAQQSITQRFKWMIPIGLGLIALFIVAAVAQASVFTNVWKLLSSSQISIAGAEPCGDQVSDRTCQLLRNGTVVVGCPTEQGYTGECKVTGGNQQFFFGSCTKRSCTTLQWIGDSCEKTNRKNEGDCKNGGTVSTTYQCTNSAYLNDMRGCMSQRAIWNPSVELPGSCDNKVIPPGATGQTFLAGMEMCKISEYCSNSAYSNPTTCEAKNGDWVGTQSCSIAGESASECTQTFAWHPAHCSDGSGKLQSECSGSVSASGGRPKYCIKGVCVSGWGSAERATSGNGRMCISGSCIKYEAIGPVDGALSDWQPASCPACGGGKQTRSCIREGKNGGKSCAEVAQATGGTEKACNTPACPVDGYWTYDGTSCSQSCGPGKQTQRCVPPQNGGQACQGNAGVKDCTIADCPPAQVCQYVDACLFPQCQTCLSQCVFPGADPTICGLLPPICQCTCNLPPQQVCQ